MQQDSFVPLEDLKSTTISVPLFARKWTVRILPLSVRLKHTLGHLACKTLGDLQGVTFGRVLKTPGCGQKTIRELEHYLTEVELGAPGQPSHATPATPVQRSEQDSERKREALPP